MLREEPMARAVPREAAVESGRLIRPTFWGCNVACHRHDGDEYRVDRSLLDPYASTEQRERRVRCPGDEG